MSKIAVVTGGTGGLGTAICKFLTEQGRQTIAVYYPPHEQHAYEWREQRLQEGYDIPVVAIDVADFDYCKAALHRIEQDLGPVEILVNNAGITRDAVLKSMPKESWEAVINTNLSSVYNMTVQVFEGMCKRGWGRIVNISSVNGQKGQFGQANYSAAKAGVHGFTMAVAQEGARKGVTVNTVSPGYVKTDLVMAMREDILQKIVDQVPVGRLGEPEEIARVVAFLVADESGYITGADMYVNGGLYYH